MMANSLNVSLQANWYKAEQYCRFHGMHLASINSAEEQRELEDHIQSFGKRLFDMYATWTLDIDFPVAIPLSSLAPGIICHQAPAYLITIQFYFLKRMLHRQFPSC